MIYMSGQGLIQQEQRDSTEITYLMSTDNQSYTISLMLTSVTLL